MRLQWPSRAPRVRGRDPPPGEGGGTTSLAEGVDEYVIQRYFTVLAMAIFSFNCATTRRTRQIVEMLQGKLVLTGGVRTQVSCNRKNENASIAQDENMLAMHDFKKYHKSMHVGVYHISLMHARAADGLGTHAVWDPEDASCAADTGRGGP